MSFILDLKGKLFTIHTESDKQISCPRRIITINPEILLYACNNHDFYDALKTSNTIIVPDGIGIVWMCKLLGCKNIQRMPGIEYGEYLLKQANIHYQRLAILGADDNTLAQCLGNLSQKYPNINYCYSHHGYINSDDYSLDNIYTEILNAKPDYIFTAMPFQQQELINAQLITQATSINMPVNIIGLGGSLDVWAGKLSRAPKLWQQLNLEWLWRIVLQPKRLIRLIKTLYKLLLLLI